MPNGQASAFQAVPSGFNSRLPLHVGTRRSRSWLPSTSRGFDSRYPLHVEVPKWQGLGLQNQ